MQQRASWSWVVVGALAVIGGYWLVIRSLFALELEGEWIPYGGHATAAALSGALMARHALLRPWREPLVAGVLAIAVFAILFLGLRESTFGWVASRTDAPWSLAAGIAALSALSAAGGATLTRRFATTDPSVVSSLILSAVVITGCTVMLSQLVIGLGLGTVDSGLVMIAAMFGVVLGGFVTQVTLPVYRPWVAGGGTSLYLLILTADGAGDKNVVELLAGIVMFMLVGAFGARLARRWVSAVPPPSVPPARLH